MNSKQAKEIQLPQFLEIIWYFPVYVRAGDYWYKSPLRTEEKTPSFKVDSRKNVWYDHWIGVGWTIIDFVCHLYQTTDIARALSLIADIWGGVISPAPVFMKQQKSLEEKDVPVIQRVKTIEDFVLIQYLKNRSIPIDLAEIYLQEVHYTVGKKEFRALGFRNDAGWFEVRNSAFKWALGVKEITYIPSPGRKDVAVFEGVFDFISALSYFWKREPVWNVLILNSVSLIDRGIARLQKEWITQGLAFLDHDDAGERTLSILQKIEGMTFRDGSAWYLGYKDVNEFLIEKWVKNISRER